MELQRQGLEVNALRNRPEAKPEYHWLLDAYRVLSRSRQVGGMGEFYIPLTEYKAYCEMFHIKDVEQKQFLLNVVGATDAILLHERYEAQKTS